ncbi:MAG: hypothetical protein SFW35_03435 [Chitinophagales bacterium]|nr:hypothetical protein [Chitinophagales bacterium]
MLWLLLILSILCGISCYLLFAPWFLEIDTDSGLYRVRYHRLAAFRVAMVEGEPKMFFKILWWERPITSKPMSKPEETEAAPKPKKKRKPRRRPKWVNFKLVLRLIKTFRVKHCYVNIDTDDVMLNAKLYPWVFLLGQYWGHPLYINFTHQQTVRLCIDNRASRILWTFIKHIKNS